MKSFLPLLASLSILVVNLAAEIRQFDIQTAETLGRLIYEQDIRAARATDVIFSKKIDLEAQNAIGWVVEGNEQQMLVRFVRESDGKLEALCDVNFVGRMPPMYKEPDDRRLNENQLAQISAARLARAALTERHFERYNFVYLPDPERDGLILYALAASMDPDEIVVGGHYRFSFSRDGKTLLQKDALFKNPMVMNRKSAGTKNGKIVGLTVSTLVSTVPMETHVFVSLLHRLPLYVINDESVIFTVENGRSLDQTNSITERTSCWRQPARWSHAVRSTPCAHRSGVSA